MKIKIIFAILVFISTQSALACEWEDGDRLPPGARSYSRAHSYSYPGTGVIAAADSLDIWPGSKSENCFHFSAISDDAHLCEMTGSLTGRGKSQYEYLDKTCQIRLSIGKGSARVTVRTVKDGKVIKGTDSCQPVTEEFICGTHTPIIGGVYRIDR